MGLIEPAGHAYHVRELIDFRAIHIELIMISTNMYKDTLLLLFTVAVVYAAVSDFVVCVTKLYALNIYEYDRLRCGMTLFLFFFRMRLLDFFFHTKNHVRSAYSFKSFHRNSFQYTSPRKSNDIVQCKQNNLCIQ